MRIKLPAAPALRSNQRRNSNITLAMPTCVQTCATTSRTLTLLQVESVLIPMMLYWTVDIGASAQTGRAWCFIIRSIMAVRTSENW